MCVCVLPLQVNIICINQFFNVLGVLFPIFHIFNCFLSCFASIVQNLVVVQYEVWKVQTLIVGFSFDFNLIWFRVCFISISNFKIDATGNNSQLSTFSIVLFCLCSTEWLYVFIHSFSKSENIPILNHYYNCKRVLGFLFRHF